MKIEHGELILSNKSGVEGYAELYCEKRTDPRGITFTDYMLGDIRKKLEDRPRFVEYSVSTHKWIGTVMVKLELL